VLCKALLVCGVDADEKQMIFDELTPEIYLLMNDKYGNYVIQKYFEFGSDGYRESIH
jgi:hypothetical protein